MKAKGTMSFKAAVMKTKGLADAYRLCHQGLKEEGVPFVVEM